MTSGAMEPRPREILLTGRDATLPAARLLRAGPVAVELDGVALRRAADAGGEVFQQVYLAVRDPGWSNLPMAVSDLAVSEGPGPAFEVSFRAHHTGGGQDFAWEGRYTGAADGSIEVRMSGATTTGLDYNRLGFCVLHGTRTFAGQRYRGRRGGVEHDGILPESIGIQGFAEGTLQGLFEPFDHLEIERPGAPAVVLDVSGEDFEMEDQRNFADASFKTYSSPIARGGPYRLEPGARLEQSVRFGPAAADGRHDPTARTDRARSVRIGAPTGQKVPPVGVAAASDGEPLTPSEVARVAAVRPAHVLVEVRAGEEAERSRLLAAAAAEAAVLGAPLHVDLIADAADAEAIAPIVRSLADLTPVPAALHLVSTIMEPPDRGESARMLRAARAAAADVAPDMVVGVSDSFAFTNLHRWPFEGEVIGSLAFPLSPTVHLADDESIIENLDAVDEMVPSIRDRMGDRPVSVAPITLATRHGPYPDGAAAPGELPEPVDARQPALITAAWTVGCIAALARSGATSATLFESVGWRGITERDGGSPMPDRFASRPRDVFAVWHVLADLADLCDADVLVTTLAPEPTFTADIAVLATRDATGTHVLLASLARGERVVTLEPGGERTGAARVRMLDAAVLDDASVAPEAFRRGGRDVAIADGRLELTLDAYAVARVDLA